MSIANTTIRLKKSLVSGNTPSTLDSGELAINAADDKLFFAKPGGSISYITNQQSFATVNANSSLILASSGTDTLTLVPGINMSITACTVTKTITFDSTATGGGGGGTLDQFARDTANSASSNTIYTQGVDETQNTRLLSVESNTIYLFGALDQTNTDIISANTQLKSYTDDIVASSNTQLKSYTDGQISFVNNNINNSNTQLKSYTDGAITSANNQLKDYVDGELLYAYNVGSQQNTRIGIAEANTVYLFGALNQTNTDIISANTQLKSYTDGVVSSSNTQLKSYVDGQVSYIFDINSHQNTRIGIAEANTIYLFGALNQTNTIIVNANTQLKSYTDGAIASANNQLKDYTDASISSANTQLKNYVDGSVSQANTWLQANDAYTLSVSKTYTDNSNTQLKSYSDGSFFLKSGGNITGPVTISSNVTITGNLIVSGNVTTVSANNLVVQDNMIYLNNGNHVTNPDLGIAGNYNDGIYRHAGFFRDASDGIWKVYDQYLPEPDASPYIDTSNSSFRIASFQANTLSLTANPGTSPFSVASSTLVNNLNVDYLDGQHGAYYSPVTFTQQAFNVANSAASNTIYQSGVDVTQNSRISTVESNTVYLFGALNQTNTNIVSANTQLKSYTDGLFSYNSGINTTQNTNITGATTLAQAAYNKANTVTNYLPLTGGTLSGTLTVSKSSGASWLINAKTTGYTNDSGIWSDASNNLQLVARNSSNTIAVLLDSNASASSYINFGNFGIGTTTPSYKLSIAGTVGIGESGSTGNRLLVSSAASGAVINQNDNSPIKLQILGTDVLTVDYPNNVGIGITSPLYKLDVNDTATNGKGIRVTGGGSGGELARFERTVGASGSFVSVHCSGNDPTVRFIRAGSANGFAIGVNDGDVFSLSRGYVGDNDILTINTANNVGIGTSSPSHKLHVRQGDVCIENGASSSGTSRNTGVRFWTDRAFGGELHYGTGSQSTGYATALFGRTIDTVSLRLGAYPAGSDAQNQFIEYMTILNTGNVGIGVVSPSYKLQVNGSFAATTKSFVIDHPTKPGKKLRYGSLEGPENGVYVRGKLSSNVIELPEYWTKLVDPESITVQLTPIGKHQNLYVKNIIDNKIIIAGCREINCFYVVYAERIDVDKLEIEID